MTVVRRLIPRSGSLTYKDSYGTNPSHHRQLGQAGRCAPPSHLASDEKRLTEPARLIGPVMWQVSM